MSSSRDHHAKAEELLGQARTAQDQVSLSLILAEAQVHATLALSAEPGTSPPGPGQPETRSTPRGEELPPAVIQPYGPGRREVRPPGQTTPRTPAWETLPQWHLPWHPGQQPAAPAPEPPGQTPTPPYPGPPRRRRRQPAERPEDLEAAEPGEQEPDATKQPPTPDNPAGQEPGKPDEPEPGGFRPF